MNLNQCPSTYQPNALPLGQTSSPLPLITLGPFLFFLQFLLINTTVCAFVRKVRVCVCACMHVCACGSTCVCSCFCSIFIVLFSRGRQWNFLLSIKKVLPIKLYYTALFMRLKPSTPSLHAGDEACKLCQAAYASSQPLPSLPLWF